MPLTEPVGYIVEDADANVVMVGVVEHEHEIEYYFIDDLLFLDVAIGSDDGIWLEREEVLHGIPGGTLRIAGAAPIGWQEGAAC